MFDTATKEQLMSTKRTYLIAGCTALALGAGGGAIALAADGPDLPAAAASTPTQGMGRGMAATSMMKQLDAAEMGRMASGMPMKLDAGQLQRMTNAHNAMARGMMGDSMMRDAGEKKGG
jgi:hypothetical protein